MEAGGLMNENVYFMVYGKIYTKEEIIDNADRILNSGLYYTNFAKDVKAEHVPVVLKFKQTKLDKEIWDYIRVFQLFCYKNGRVWEFNNNTVVILDVKEYEDTFLIQIIDPSRENIDYVYNLSTFKHEEYVRRKLLFNMELIRTADFEGFEVYKG